MDADCNKLNTPPSPSPLQWPLRTGKRSSPEPVFDMSVLGYFVVVEDVGLREEDLLPL